MNPRLLAFFVWIAFCMAMVAMHPLPAALAVITTVSVLALALRWVCRMLLQVSSEASEPHPGESVRQENY